MKLLALFVTILGVVAVVNGQAEEKSKNTNHNVIVIGANKGAPAPADGTAQPAANPRPQYPHAL